MRHERKKKTKENLFYTAFRLHFILIRFVLYKSHSWVSLDKHESSPLSEVQTDECDNERGGNVFVHVA